MTSSSLLERSKVRDDITSFSCWQQGPAATLRTWVALQDCTANSAASLCTRRRGNAEDRPSGNLATRGEGEELSLCVLSAKSVAQNMRILNQKSQINEQNDLLFISQVAPVFTFLHLLSSLLIGHPRIGTHTQTEGLPQEDAVTPHVAL